MAKKIAIINMSDDQLQEELRATNRKIDIGVITWENASKETRSCPFGAFNHTGKVSAVVESPDWKAGIAVQLRCEAERRNGGSLASVKAGHQRKAETCSATVRTTGMKASESTVTVQLALAQSLAERARKCGVEITARKERQAAADAIAAEVNAAKEDIEAKRLAFAQRMLADVDAGTAKTEAVCSNGELQEA